MRLCVEGLGAGEMLPWYVRDQQAGVLAALGVEVVPYARLYGIDGTTVYFEHAASGAPLVMEAADTLVLAQGHARNDTLELSLAAWPGTVTVVGDALAPRTAEEAVLEGLEAALAI